LQTLRKHVVFALRHLGKSPAFTLAAVLSLVLGIGANTAMFSVMDTILLRSLPVRHPDGLYYLRMANGQDQPQGATSTGDSNSAFSMPVFEVLRQQQRAFESLIAYVPLSSTGIAVEAASRPFEAQGSEVSGNFFSGLTINMQAGRELTQADEQHHSPVMVLSYAFWTKAFARNPHVLGSTVFVKGMPFTVVGVAARGFFGLEPAKFTDFWIPLQNNAKLNAWGTPSNRESLYGSPNWWCLRLVARLAPGVTPQQAQAAAAGVFLHAASEGIGSIDAKQWKPLLAFDQARGIEGYNRQYRESIEILMGLVLLILLIALTNVAMMINARNTGRSREFSLRLALGAKRAHLFVQLLTESSLLVLVGATLAWLFAVEATRWLAGVARIDSGLMPNSTALLFMVSVSAMAALLFALAPLRSAIRMPMASVLRAGGMHITLDRRAVTVGNVALVMQIALCLMLMMAGGLLLRTLSQYQNQPLGMDAEHLLVFGLSPYHSQSSEQKLVFYRTLLNRIRALPGVRGASTVSIRPGGQWRSGSEISIDGAQQPGVMILTNYIGPDYFQTIGTPILKGREFNDADSPQSAKVIVVNRAFVRKFFPHGDSIGHRVTAGGVDANIIGVVADSKYSSPADGPGPTGYLAIAQQQIIGSQQIEVRTWGDPLALLPEVRHTITMVDPTLPLVDPMSEAQQFAISYAQPTMFASLGGFFGLLAGMLVAIGLYGTLAYRTSCRTVEIGIRMALGIQRGQVMWLVLRESLTLAAWGLLLSIPLMVLSSRLLGSMLWNISPYDLVSISAATGGVFVIIAAASFIPARRAASVDPMRALRSE
jgi:predicted permease